MDEDSRNPNLEEDEELSALRFAALATIKQRTVQNNEALTVPTKSSFGQVNSNDNDNCASNHIPFIQTDRSAHPAGHGWRKNNQSVRRRLGNFPKSSQRSNLIVISPVSLNENKDLDRDSAPSLILPQHKWYVSSHEDSMSPKSFRRTGPTRFNRHESDSDDSDSDLNNSDDSCSNETILQDEPPEKFSNSGREAESYENVLDKKYASERRLSFPTPDSNKLDIFVENDSVYNSLKATYSSYERDNKSSPNYRNPTSHSDSELTQKHTPEKLKDVPSTFETVKSPMKKKGSCENVDSSRIFTNEKYSEPSADYEQKYARNYNASVNNLWDYKDSFQDNVYLNNEAYSSSISKKILNHSEAKQSSSNDLMRESRKQGDEYPSRKSSFKADEDHFADSWTPVKDADPNVKNVQNRQKRWLDSNTSRRDTTAEHFAKECNKNDDFNYLERTTCDSKSFQSTSYSSIKESDIFYPNDKRTNFNDSKLQKKSISPEYWKRYESNERSRKSPSPELNYQHFGKKVVTRQESNQKVDFSQKHKPNDYGQHFSNQISNLKQHNNLSSENLHQDLNPKRVRRKSSSSSSESKSYKSNDSSKLYGAKAKNSFGYDRKEYNQREDKSSDDSDSASSSDRSWRKHERHSDRKRRERSWSAEAYEKESKPDFNNAYPTLKEKWSDHISSSKGVKLRKSEDKESLLEVKDKNKNAHMYEDYKSTNDSNLRSTKNFHHRRHLGSENDNYQELDRKSHFKPKDHVSTSEERFKESGKVYTKPETYRSRSNSPYNKTHDSKQSFYHKSTYYQNSSRSRSRSSSCSSTDSSSSSASAVRVKSVSSVIKSVPQSNSKVESKCDIKYLDKKSIESDSLQSIKKGKHLEEHSKKVSASNEIRNHAENNKRVSVHMRLGTFPRKRVIQMTKDVEAAFVNTSSDEELDVNNKCKKQNFLVTKMFDSKPEDNGSSFLNNRYIKGVDAYRERSRNFKTSR